MQILAKNASSLEAFGKQRGISEEIMMENAGSTLAKATKGYKNILILLAGGSNSADGLVAARHIHPSSKVTCLLSVFKGNTLFDLQLKRARALGIDFIDANADLSGFDCVIDAMFGTGLSRKLSPIHEEIIIKANKLKAYKIACDIPSGLGYGRSFKADLTLCMGVLKLICFEDFAKDFVGKIKCVPLGFFKPLPNLSLNYLLEKKDFTPIKRKANSNKGSYGEVFVIGSKSAGSLSALAALKMGAGKASLLQDDTFSPLIIPKNKISKANVYAIGMGAKNLHLDCEYFLKNALVIDANCFDDKNILRFFSKKNCVLTPHPKEFCKAYEIGFNKALSIASLQANRFFYAREFSLKYPCILVLKGANTLVAKKGRIFVINQGDFALAKGGSGDVLSGVIAALLANMPPLKATLNAVLAHALTSSFAKNKNAFSALDQIKYLEKI